LPKDFMTPDLQAITRSELWRQGYRHAPLVLGVVLVVAVAWQAAALTWTIVETAVSQPSLPPPAALDGQLAAAPAERTSIDAVADAHLFGQADAQPTEIAAAAVD